jgi:hypothetical protein
VKNHPHKLILIKQIVNHPVTYRIYDKIYDILNKRYKCKEAYYYLQNNFVDYIEITK